MAGEGDMGSWAVGRVVEPWEKLKMNSQGCWCYRALEMALEMFDIAFLMIG